MNAFVGFIIRSCQDQTGSDPSSLVSADNNESDSQRRWRNLLSDYRNISDSYVSLSKTNKVLTRDNEELKKQSGRLEEQTQLLNATSAELRSMNLALTVERSRMMEQIVNLTSVNEQILQEHDRLVQSASEQEEERFNMSETIKHLVNTNARLEEEREHLSEVDSLLRDEIFQVKEKNQELLEVNSEFQREIDGERAAVAELQDQNQNLSATLRKERLEAAELERSRRRQMERMAADLHSVNETYGSLDLYCPVVHHETKERICRTCDRGWRLFQMKCYHFSTRALTWRSSRAWCRTQGGDLLIINSEPEQKFVFESSRTVEGGGRLWVGMTDMEVEGDWRWVDGSAVASDEQYWLSRPGMSTEPDDWKQDDPHGEDCGHIDTSENPLRSWMDGSCMVAYRWICEKNM
ncbi:uncharacterized protein ACBR49_018508 [Aulostomus maculatus]